MVDDPRAAKTGYCNTLPRLCSPVRNFTLTGSWSICEYLEERAPGPSMLIGSAEQRAEIRRLVAWADEIFFQQVSLPALSARLPGWANRQTRTDGDLGSATRHADRLLDELESLLDRRTWLAGPMISLADLAAAAQISVADYLGLIDWSGHDQVSTWYSVMKSRRSFQPLLADRVGALYQPALIMTHGPICGVR